MKIKSKFLIIFFLPILLLVGCTNENEIVETKPRSFIRVEEAEETDNISALNYIIEPITEQISVLYTMDDEFAYYDLEAYEVTDSEIRFAYDGKAVELSAISDTVYEDAQGNTYQKSLLASDEER